MDKLIGTLVLFVGIFISIVSGYFSILGLAALFSASVVPIIIMALSLELAKVSGALWLHRYWSISPLLLRSYILLGVIVLMVITSFGVFGFLSKAHLDQQAAIIPERTNIELIDNQISFIRNQISRDEAEINSLDAIIDGYIRNDRITQSREVRLEQEEIRSTLNASLSENYEKIQDLERQKIEIQTTLQEADIKLGPIQYLIEIFNFTDTDQAVRIFIFSIMMVFDPIAICLILAGQWSLFGSAKIIRQNETINNILKEEEALAKVVNRKKQLRFEEEKENKVLEKRVQLMAQQRRFEQNNSMKDIT